MAIYSMCTCILAKYYRNKKVLHKLFPCFLHLFYTNQLYFLHSDSDNFVRNELELLSGEFLTFWSYCQNVRNRADQAKYVKVVLWYNFYTLLYTFYFKWDEKFPTHLTLYKPFLFILYLAKIESNLSNVTSDGKSPILTPPWPPPFSNIDTNSITGQFSNYVGQ